MHVDALGYIFRRWIAIGRIKSDLAADAPPVAQLFIDSAREVAKPFVAPRRRPRARCVVENLLQLLTAASGPTATSSNVRTRAALGGQADIKQGKSDCVDL
jgi:hypothetical protein